MPSGSLRNQDGLVEKGVFVEVPELLDPSVTETKRMTFRKFTSHILLNQMTSFATLAIYLLRFLLDGVTFISLRFVR